MLHSRFHHLSFASLGILAVLSLSACGQTGAKAGTQTGDEGEQSESGGTAGATSTSSGTNMTNVGGATTASAANGVTAASATNGAATDGVGTTNSVSSTSAGGAGGAGASSGGASSTGSGGVAGSDGTQTESSGNSTTGGGAPGGDCDPACGEGFICCDGACVNPANDINNCGACGVVCGGDTPYCQGDSCAVPPCDGGGCANGETCCGSECCGAGQLCCVVNVGPSFFGCTEPVNGTCPVGCPTCDCAAPDTPVATPSGERAIASLRVGDLVYSVDEHGIVVVPIVQTNQVRVEHHHVMRVLLDDGTELRISPRHPLFGSGVFGDLRSGSSLGDKTVREVVAVAYHLPFTYDILPGSKTGAYFAGGALIGSTLAH